MDFRELNEFLKDMSGYLIVIIIVILLFIYVISFQEVMGPSMSPTFEQGNLIFVSKIHYKFSNPKRGDVIVFQYNGEKNLIKRVIGLPGEEIKYQDNQLYINNVAYEDPYSGNTKTNNFTGADIGNTKVPDKCYLVLGDNRENSADSREIGYVCKKDVIGKVVMRFWPLNEIKIVR
jgi:signal peptidase I